MLNLKLKNKLNLKSLAIGITLGITVSSFIPVFGVVQEYLLTKVNYPILVNGEEYVDKELPSLNLRGSTYIPLRAIGDILDAKVEWNDELKRVEIGEVVVKDVVENEANLTKENNYEQKKVNDSYYNTVYFKIDNKGLYGSDVSSDVQYKNGVPHIMITGMNQILDILSNNYHINNSPNPFLKGVLFRTSNENYVIEAKMEYKNINLPNTTYEIYNTFNPSKKYIVSNTESMSRPYVDIEDVISFFGYPKNTYNMELNNENNYAIINVNKVN